MYLRFKSICFNYCIYILSLVLAGSNTLLVLTLTLTVPSQHNATKRYIYIYIYNIYTYIYIYFWVNAKIDHNFFSTWKCKRMRITKNVIYYLFIENTWFKQYSNILNHVMWNIIWEIKRCCENKCRKYLKDFGRFINHKSFIFCCLSGKKRFVLGSVSILLNYFLTV